MANKPGHCSGDGGGSYLGRWMMVTSLVARTRVRAYDAIRACHARDFPGLQLNHTAPEANKRLNVAPKKSRKSREPAFTETMLAYWPRYFRQKINRSYRDRINEILLVGPRKSRNRLSGLNNWVC